MHAEIAACRAQPAHPCQLLRPLKLGCCRLDEVVRHLRDQLQKQKANSQQAPGSISQPRLRSAGLAYFSSCMLRYYQARPSAEGQRAKGGTFLTLTDWQHKGFSYHKGDLWLLSSTPCFQVLP